MTKKKKIAIIIIIAVLLLIAININTIRILLGNWFTHKETLEIGEWENGKSYMNVQYSDKSDSDYLHLFVPDGDGPFPLYIMVHGGGFFYNDLDSRQAALFYQKVRDKGYAVATINYRLASEANFPGAIEDVKAAVRFLRANAEIYNLDSKHFAIAGESAGGYLACMAAVTSDDEFNDGENGDVSGEVQALVDFYGCMEFYKFDEQFKELKVPKLIRMIANSWLSDATKGTGAESVEEVWIGKTVSQMEEGEKETYSVPYYAKRNLGDDSNLQVVILHGDADITVPYLQSEEFAGLLGGLIGEDKVTYRLFHNYGHAADGFYSEDTINWVLEQIELGE
jgi:acetyl esterase/lipase